MPDEIFQDFWSSIIAPGEDLFFAKDVVIPSLVDEIPDQTFYRNDNINTLTISDGVKVIGFDAFSFCYNLKWAKIPASVYEIKEQIFKDCTQLEEICVDPNNDNYCSIDGVLFRKQPFELLRYPPKKRGHSYVVPDGVERIGNGAFEECSELESIELPTSLLAIESSAFSSCSSLKFINIPDSVTRFGAFILFKCTALTGISFPRNLEIIPEGMLFGCTSLRDVEIPTSVNYIEPLSFIECTNLQRISIPENLTKFYSDCFNECNNLERFDVSPNNLSLCEIDGVLYSKDKKTLVRVPPNYADECFTVPESVCEINDNAFESCRNIKTIVLPGHVTDMGVNEIFEDPTAEETEAPDNAESSDISVSSESAVIEDAEDFDPPTIPTIFSGCTSLEKIEVAEENPLYCSIDGVLCSKDRLQLLYYPQGRKQKQYSVPDGVTCIGKGAFSDCNELEQVELPTSVTCIDNWAFSNCEGLSQIITHSELERISSTALWNKATLIRK